MIPKIIYLFLNLPMPDVSYLVVFLSQGLRSEKYSHLLGDIYNVIEYLSS